MATGWMLSSLPLSLLLLLDENASTGRFAGHHNNTDAASSALLGHYGLRPPSLLPVLEEGGDTASQHDDSTPALEITFPTNHSWWQMPINHRALKTLPIYFSTRPHFQIPRDGYLLVTGAKLPQEGLRYSDADSNFVMMDLEPGSHFFMFALQTWEHQLVSGSSNILHIEIVVPQQHFHRQWRYVLQEADKKPVAFVNLPGSNFRSERGQKRDQQLDSHSIADQESPHGQPRIPVCYVGTMSGTIDGQKKMWLQVMKALSRPREKSDSNAALYPVFDFQMKSFEDFQGETPMKQALRDLNVSLRAVRLSISLDEANAYGVTLQNSQQFLLDQLYEVLPHARSSSSSVSTADATQLHTIRVGFAASYWEEITREMGSCRDGIVIFANSRSKGDNGLALAARMAGVRSIVMELANLYPEHIDVDVVLAPSRFAVSHPSVLGVVSFRQSYVLSTGIDIDTFAPRRTAPRKLSPHFVIGYVGRLSAEKSVGMVLVMAKFVVQRCSSCRFRIVGDGPLKEHLRILADEWELTDAIEFVNGIYHDEAELARQLQEMDAYFSPCFFETLGIAALEAMSVGVPVIGYQTGGVSEYLIDSYNGFALEDPSPETFYSALDTFIQNPEQRYQMGRNARQTVLDRFSHETSFAKYAALYRRLARRA